MSLDRRCSIGASWLNSSTGQAFLCFSTRQRETASVTAATAPNFSTTPVARLSNVPLALTRRSPDRWSQMTALAPGKEMLARIVAMLTRLIDRFDRDEPPFRKD
jgi:hypothetical protein